MNYTGALHSFLNNKVLDEPETNEKIIRMAVVSSYTEANPKTPDELARDNFARAKELMKNRIHSPNDIEME